MAEIEIWREEQLRKAGRLPSGKEGDDEDGGCAEAILKERLRKLKLENDEKENQLIDAEVVMRLMTRTETTAKQLLYQLVFEIPVLLPSTLPDVVKEEIRSSVKRKLDQVSSFVAAEYRAIYVNEIIEEVNRQRNAPR